MEVLCRIGLKKIVDDCIAVLSVSLSCQKEKYTSN